MEQVEAAAKAASQAVADANRTERRNTRSSNTDPNDDRGPIEIPYSLRKGNLPLHYKQLLNVCLRKPMNDGVTESQLEQGKQLGDSMLARGSGYQK